MARLVINYLYRTIVLTITMLVTSSCSNDYPSNFHKFLDFFPLSDDLDYIIDEKFMTNNNSNLKRLDSVFIVGYITSDSSISPSLRLLDIYSFTPLVKFNFASNSIAVIFKKEGGAAGIEKEYFFNIYSSSGDLLSSFLFAEMKADCSFYYIQEGFLKNNQIHINQKSFSTDCESGYKKSISTSRIDYVVNGKGKIEKLK